MDSEHEPQGGPQVADEQPGESPASETASDVEAPTKVAPRRRVPRLKLPHDARFRAFGLLWFVLGAGLQFLLMASDQRFTFSVPLGLFSCLLAAVGVLQAIGSFSCEDEAVARQLDWSQLKRPVGEAALSTVALLGLLKSAVAGIIPQQIAVCAVLVPALFLWFVAACFRFARVFGAFGPDDDGVDRPLWRRHGFWLIAVCALLYLPMLGSFSLIDPWETHYGEVAREMLSRDDWISLWWAQDGWFWSKPILDFWIQGLSFSLLGVHYAPDQMLSGVERGLWPQPEWAARMPIFLLTVLGSYVLYRCTARFFGRRAAFLGGLVLTTTPYWLLIAHQTMTDMPYVATLTAGMGLLLVGMFSSDAESLRVLEFRWARARLRFSAAQLLLVVVLITALPQILYLASRNVSLHFDRIDSAAEQATHPSLSVLDLARGHAVPRGFRPHKDEISEGSGGGNCELAGNAACRPIKRLHNTTLQPGWMALLYSILLGAFVWANRRERSFTKTAYLAAWYMTALAGMAKGAPGLVLPLFVFGAYVALKNDWKQLVRADLGGLLLLITVVGLPWFVQMYLRHGPGFIDRLLWHDMYKRAFEHVHDTNQGDDVSFRYYVWQLGYGLFPWNGICAGGLVWWFRRERRDFDRTHQAALVLFIWTIAAFGMFTITLTKFHHYILPMVPPLAALSGLLLDDALGTPPAAAQHDTRRSIAYYVGLGLGVFLLLLGTLLCLPGSLIGSADVEISRFRPLVGAAVVLVAGALLVFCSRRFGPARSAGDTQDRIKGALAGAVGLVAAAAVLLAGRDMAVDKSRDLNGDIRLLHLFTYQYQRPWPDSLDFRPSILAFTLVAGLLFLGWLLARLRPHAVVAASMLGLLCAGWITNLYLVRLAPHWGQRETMITYYQTRKGPQEPLVAFQMNWKGENFYTSNHVPAFVSTGKKFKNWLEDQKAGGTKVMFFTTEHTRRKGLERELGDPEHFEVLTKKDLNNKFFLARVQFD